eukprot:4480810-Prymnesium_polylepis.1
MGAVLRRRECCVFIPRVSSSHAVRVGPLVCCISNARADPPATLMGPGVGSAAAPAAAAIG